MIEGVRVLFEERIPAAWRCRASGAGGGSSELRQLVLESSFDKENVLEYEIDFFIERELVLPLGRGGRYKIAARDGLSFAAEVLQAALVEGSADRVVQDLDRLVCPELRLDSIAAQARYWKHAERLAAIAASVSREARALFLASTPRTTPMHERLGVGYVQRVATLAALGHALHLSLRGVGVGYTPRGRGWWWLSVWCPGSPHVPTRVQYLVAGYAAAIHCAVAGVPWPAWAQLL